MFSRVPATKWVVFSDVTQTTKPFMRDVTVVEPDWLVELAYVINLPPS